MPGRRRAQGVDDDLIEMFADLPWWSVPVATVAVFLLMVWLLPTVFPARTPADRASIGYLVTRRSVAGVVASLVALLGLAGQLERRKRHRLFGLNQDLDSVRALGWRDFERWVAEAFRRQGYDVQETADGADGGVDLVLLRRGETSYVQCKQWRARKVDVRRVRELYGVMAAGSVSRGIVITAGRFTSAAEKEADDKPIQLIGGGNLLRLLGNAPEGGPELGSATLAGGTPAPDCPRCGKPMVVRHARRGSTPGATFWGCPSYPACRGTREYS